MRLVVETTLPLPLVFRGKVRDTYRLDAVSLLMVATDRISAFDVVLPTPIPDKGRVLNQLSAFWFAKTRPIVRNHYFEDQAIPVELLAAEPGLDQRGMRIQSAEPIPFECIVRGYLSGSAWIEYRRTGAIAGEGLPSGLRESDRLPEPIFTPATKAREGHDENISRAELARRTSPGLAADLERFSLSLYREAAVHAERCGLILADTKMEFGCIDGTLLLIDELLTPDSSRYWDAEAYRPGGPQPSYDKQYVRDYLMRLGWDQRTPPPALPAEVVEGTRDRYLEALCRLTGAYPLRPERTGRVVRHV